MISTREPTYRLAEDSFTRCLDVIERSGVVERVTSLQSRGAGGRPRAGRRFTLTAVLTVGLAILRVGRAASLAEIHRVIGTLTDDQLTAVGMVPAGRSTSGGDNIAHHGDYKAFHNWLTRLLAPLDPGADLPARRVTNAEHRAMVARRGPEQRCAVETARRHLHDVVNVIVAGSVDEPAPAAYRGDIVADETIVDLAGRSAGLGTRDTKNRAAAYAGRYYVRDSSDNSVHNAYGNVVSVGKAGFGIGITAVSRVGGPDALYSVAPVITGVAIHPPTSGSVEGLGAAIAAHQDSGFDTRAGSRARLPMLVTDMGYNVKEGFNDLCLDTGYAPVVRYPRNWGVVQASGDDGPVQIAGEFYCPAARDLLAGFGDVPLVVKTRELAARKDAGDGGGYAAHDARIAALFPYLMGTNSRPRRGQARPGRPGADGGESRVKVDLVCPAVQGRVACPLKPGSLPGGGAVVLPDPRVPVATPAWEAGAYRCCRQSQLRLTLSDRQWKRAQWGLVPGSWEHAVFYEAARSATEQRFSIMKNQHITGVQNLTWTPRREPLLCLLIGLWVAATNLAIQDTYAEGRAEVTETLGRKLRRLTRDLGHAPTAVPPRT